MIRVLLACSLVWACLALSPLSRAGAADPAAGSPYGVALTTGVADFRDPSRCLRALELAGAAGIRWVRISMAWSWIEPNPGRFTWTAHDALVDGARRHGMEVLGTLGFTAVWNSTAPPEVTRAVDRERYPPRDYEAWGRYVYETAAHFRGRVRYWQVWNEPDLGGNGPFGFWRGSEPEFARLLAVAYESVKRADPEAQVVLGGLSLGGSPGVLNRDFLPAILHDPAYPAARYFDVLDFHHYGPAAEAKRRYDYVQAELAKAGAAGRPVWVTEVGSPSNETGREPPEYAGPEGQARYLREMVPYLLSLGVARVFWFTLFDTPVVGPQFDRHGLLDETLAPKPAYDAYRDLIASATPPVQAGEDGPEQGGAGPGESAEGGRLWLAAAVGAGAAVAGGTAFARRRRAGRR